MADVIPIGAAYRLLRGPKREAARQELLQARRVEAFDRAVNNRATDGDLAMFAGQDARRRLMIAYGPRPIRPATPQDLVRFGGLDLMLTLGTGLVRRRPSLSA